MAVTLPSSKNRNIDKAKLAGALWKKVKGAKLVTFSDCELIVGDWIDGATEFGSRYHPHQQNVAASLNGFNLSSDEWLIQAPAESSTKESNQDRPLSALADWRTHESVEDYLNRTR